MTHSTGDGQTAPEIPKGSVEKVVIIGSGPAAHTAAIYTARYLSSCFSSIILHSPFHSVSISVPLDIYLLFRASLHPLLFEGMMAGGVAPGGQLTTTTEVENFPGFPEGINGYDLMVKMREQSVRWGTRVETQVITS